MPYKNIAEITMIAINRNDKKGRGIIFHNNALVSSVRWVDVPDLSCGCSNLNFMRLACSISFQF